MKPNVVSSFVAHLSFPKGEKVADFKVVLWMPDMGHGTSAVELSPMGANKYNVSKANFTMAGAWEVQLKFKINSDEYQINIPIKITE